MCFGPGAVSAAGSAVQIRSSREAKSWLLNVTFLLSLGPYLCSRLRGLSSFGGPDISPKSHMHIRDLLKRIVPNHDLITFSQGPRVNLGLSPHLYLAWSHHHLRSPPWALAPLALTHTAHLGHLFPSSGVKMMLHLALSVYPLSKTSGPRNSWILTPAAINTLRTFNARSLVTPLQGPAPLLDRVSCHRTRFLAFPPCMHSQGPAWPPAPQWWQLDLTKCRGQQSAV